MRKNLSVQLPTFEGVGIAGFNIQDIKPVVAEGEKALRSGDFVIQIYDEYGIIKESYSYYLGDETDSGDGPDGWDDDEGINLIEKTFDVGEAFNISAKKAGTLTYVGQVLVAQTSIPVRKNLSAQGNFRATGVDIQKITPVVGEGEKALRSGDFVIQIYDEYGIIKESYSYYLGDETDSGNGPNGWYDDEGINLIEKTFNPGEGFTVSAKKTGELIFEALSL